jgi:SAM-dependent methyltransferase
VAKRLLLTIRSGTRRILCNGGILQTLAVTFIGASYRDLALRILPARAHPWLRALQRHRRRTLVSRVRFGNLRRLTPFSRDFGYDRGLPVDRYYIENFLARRAEDIRGRVLEVKDASYTRKYGGRRVKTSDVLDVEQDNPQATIIADLADADHVPSGVFDCIILTQTLHLIYDVPSAIQTLYRILKPGGVLLATFPGVSQIAHKECGDYWRWSFTQLSTRELFEESFPSPYVLVEAFGNVLAAMCLLHGLAAEELRPEELDFRDPDYEVLITLRALKPEQAL